MIKIIKEGTPTYKTICPDCSTIFSYQDEDLQEWRDASSGWSGKDIKCPICSKLIDHERRNK